jgi:hypothetical protein
MGSDPINLIHPISLNFIKSGQPKAPGQRPAPSASSQPEAVTMIAMFHAHLFKLNLVAAFKAAAGARACTTKTTTTKD